VKIYRSKVKPRKVDKPDKSWGILFYDEMNDYCERVSDIVNASGTAKDLISTYSKFIEGRGFNDLVFYKAIINSKGLTNDKLLRKIAFDFAFRNGFAVHVKYNANFKKAEYAPVLFSNCRLPNPEFPEYNNKIAIHTDWLGNYKRVTKDQITWIDRFNPDPNVIQNQVDEAGGWQNYKGQVLWYSTEGENYPLPIYDPVLEDIETDGRIKSRRRKKAATDYAPDFWFVQNGSFESPQEEEDFINNLRSDQGDDAPSMKLMVLKTGETKPELIPVPQSPAKTNYSIENETQAQKNIRKTFGVPQILANEDISGSLGMNNMMSEAYAMYNSMTDPERRIMEETFKLLFTDSMIVNQKNDFSVTPAFFNTGNEKAPLAVQFGVGGTQSVQNILTDPLLGAMQKINTLIVLFGLSDVQANAMVMGTPIPAQDKPE
jgi:hypothetical protein